jgi:hypothetical protein
MSFVGKSGRQFIVVASSGSSRPDGEVALIAFALPRPGDQPVDLKSAPAAAANANARVLDLPEGPGRAELVNACGSCHSLEAVTVRRRSSEQWTAQIEQMRQYGARADDAAAARIHDYLTAHFGTP